MPTMKVITADLQVDVTNVYDQNKTSISGYVSQSMIGAYPVLGPPLVKWVDIFTDTTGDIPVLVDYTSNGRLFAITAPSLGVARIICYTFDALTGLATYIGKVVINLPNLAATTHTLRGFKVDDTNPASIKAFVATTGSIAINGGLMMVNALNITDFVSVGFPTIPLATGTSQKAVYFLQDPAGVGAGQLNTVANAVAVDRANSKVYVHNGISATHQFYVYDYSIAPTVPSQNFTITIAAPGVVSLTGHSYANGDQVTPSTTGALPTGLTAGNNYFAKNVVAGVSFELSLTTGGASITTTGSQSGVHSIRRAFGITTDLFSLKTGNLPALIGTLLAVNSERFVTPSHTTNSGFPCVFFATSSNLYLGKVSELTSLATGWASLVTSNVLGASNQMTAPTVVIATWNEFLDRAVFTTSTTKIVAKKVINNLIEDIYGVLNNDYLEGVLPSSVVTQFGAITISDFKQANGWTFMIGSTAGQRGVLALNTSSSYRNGTTAIISKVLNTPRSAGFSGMATPGQIANLCSLTRVSYRTSGFGSAVGGWTLLALNGLMGAIPPANQIQFKIEYNISDTFLSNPPQMIEIFLAYLSMDQISDKWEGSVDNTSVNGASPAYTAFRLLLTDNTTKYFRAYDDSGNLVASANTTTDFALFDKSVNNGTSWAAMTGANDYSASILTTEIRYRWASPPGVRVTCSLGDS